MAKSQLYSGCDSVPASPTVDQIAPASENLRSTITGQIDPKTQKSKGMSYYIYLTITRLTNIRTYKPSFR